MKSLILAAILGASMTHGLNSAEAHPRSGPHRHTTRVVVTKPVIVRPAPVRTVVTRAVVGQFFESVPGPHIRVVHAGRTYFVHDGVYYARQGRGYTVVRPVAGVRVTTLPRGVAKVRIGGRTHYRYQNVTYRRVNSHYVVV